MRVRLAQWFVTKRRNKEILTFLKLKTVLVMYYRAALFDGLFLFHVFSYTVVAISIVVGTQHIVDHFGT